MSVSWPRARITVSAASVSNRPVGCGKPESSSSITSTVSLGPSKAVIVRSQLIRTPFALGVLGLLGVGRHLCAGAAVDDQRLVGAQPAGHPGGVHRRVAAAVDRHPAADHRPLAGGDAAQERDRVDDRPGVPGRDVHAL